MKIIAWWWRVLIINFPRKNSSANSTQLKEENKIREVNDGHHHAIIFIVLSNFILPFNCRGLENAMEEYERRPRAGRPQWALKGLLFQLRRVSR